MDNVLHRNSKVVVILKILLFSYLVTGIILLLLTFLMLKLNVSNVVLAGGIIFTYILSSFLGGFLLGKSAERRRFLWGIGMGAIYFVVLVLISILSNSIMGMDTGRTLTVMIICLLSGMVGGMLS